MDARTFVFVVCAFFALVSDASAQLLGGRRAVIETPNFRVFCSDANLAQEVAQMAEDYRRHLSKHWLDRELGAWPEKCPIQVQSSPNLPASGETKYTLMGGTVRHFQMLVSGSRERILDSVLPHEITHTILATHFAPTGKPVPRWADEGACTTVEHASERGKHDQMLVRFLSEGRGIPFASLFTMRDYPPDMMPLYAQGYSLCAFLIAQGGPKQFIAFLESGMQREDWVGAVEDHYQYPILGNLQSAWNDWVRDGGGSVASYSANARNLLDGSRVAAAASPARGGVLLASAELPLPTGNSPSNSFYLDQFRRTQRGNLSGAGAGDLVNAGQTNGPAMNASNQNEAVPYRVSQPAPFRTMGGTILR